MMREPSGCGVSSTSGEKNRTGRKGASSTDRLSLSVLNVRSLIDAIRGRKGCAKLLFGMEGQLLSGYRPRGEKVKRRVRVASNRAAKRDDGLSIDVYDEPGHLIRRAQQIAVSMFHSTMRNGVTPIQYCVLRVLQDHPGIDQVTLARLCALDTSTAADLAVRLEERGLVRRMMPMKSKRHRLLQLTTEGAALAKRLLPNAYMLSRRLLRALNKKEQSIFLRLLKKFVHLNNQESRAPLDRRFSRSRNNNSNSRAKRA
jgi:DNA-binding MarR family transcriptional regulator